MFQFLRQRKLFLNLMTKNNYNIFEYYSGRILFDYRNVLQKRYVFKTMDYRTVRCVDKNSSKEGNLSKSGSVQSQGPSKSGSSSSSSNSSNKKGSTNCKKPYKSIVRHNFSASCEEAINKQVNMELYAAYWYMSLQYHFDRDDIGLTGFSKFFKEAAEEEVDHANNLMVFQMKRGGQLKYLPVQPPPIVEWTVACAVAESIELEKQVTKSLEKLAELASDEEDSHLNDYICGEFLTEQYQGIKDLANLLSRIKRAGPGVGLVLIDYELQKDDSKKLK